MRRDSGSKNGLLEHGNMIPGFSEVLGVRTAGVRAAFPANTLNVKGIGMERKIIIL